MIKTRSIDLSVEYRKTAYSAAVKAAAEEGGSTAAAAEGAQGSGASAAAGGASGGAKAGAAVTLNATPLYVASTSKSRAATKTGTYYLYDGILIRGRYRITNTPSRVGKTPVGKNVTGWVDAADIGFPPGTRAGARTRPRTRADRPAGAWTRTRARARGPERRSPGWWRA